MSIKRIADNESGITYSLEAIIGVMLIIGTIIYLTSNMPHTAQKTEDFSKVQLMNIGRDNLDLAFITPISETCPSCLDVKVPRHYLLCIGESSPSDCVKDGFVKPNETIIFKVYYTNGTPVPRPLNFKQAVLGDNESWTDITSSVSYLNGNESYSFPVGSQHEYLIQAFDSYGWSNDVTVMVGYYNLISNTSGIFINANDTNVSGVVYDESGSGVKNLNITILDSTGSPISWSHTCLQPSNNYTLSGGNFSFAWPTCLSGGPYYIQAINYSSGLVSNSHLILYSDKSGQGAGYTLWAEDPSNPSIPPSDQDISITETYPVDLFGISNNNVVALRTGDVNNFWVNNENVKTVYFNQNSPCLPTNTTFTLFYPPANCGDNLKIRFVANVAGDYYVDEHTSNGNAIKTNGVLIHVLPLVPATGETQDNCVNGTELNAYMRRYIPLNVNYNLYLIDPTGHRFTNCPDWKTGEVINDYPTAEAVTFSKLAYIKYVPTKIDNILEYRITLWYQ